MTLLRILMLALFAANLLPADDVNEDLLAATRKGDLPQVKALLAKGADVNAKSPYGSTPLFFACDRGHVEIVKLLIDKGADVNVEDTFYHASALTWAVQKGRLEIVKLLLDHGAKSAGDVLMGGVQSGNTALLKLALDTKSADGKRAVSDKELSNALVAATRAKKTEIADLLKAAGAVPPEAPKFITLDADALRKFEGTFQGGRGGTEFDFIFTVKDGKLMGAFAGQAPLAYLPTDATHFRNDQAGVALEFNVEGGVATVVKLTQGNFNTELKRKAVAK